MTTRQLQAQVKRFLRTGDHDLLFRGWPGRDFFDCAERGSRAMIDALVAEVRRREAAVTVRLPAALPGGDLVAFTRRKVEPMVRGLFPRAEADPVLRLLEGSVVFLTPENLESIMEKSSDLHTAWQAADIYLASIGAERLTKDRWYIVGMSVETTCYVSMEYFTEKDPFADFVVHEAAHVFHNTKRGTVGLKQTRRREWLLPIDFQKRETFAYACEAYSRILERTRRPAERRDLLEKLRQDRTPKGKLVDREEYLAMLAEAVIRRNGWKAILARCSSSRAH